MLYRISDDSSEKQNITIANSLLVGALRRDLNDAYERALPDRYADGTEDQEVIPPDLEKQLKALGYIDE
jgi:hypothetical protein